MRFPSIVLALLACLPLPAAAAPRGGEAAARAALLARFDAALRGNTAGLEKLLSDDLEYCNVRAECIGKRAYIDQIASGARTYRSLTPAIGRVKLFADTAVLSGTVSAVVAREGVERPIDAAFLAVLAWRDGRWQLTSQSSTPLETKAE